MLALISKFSKVIEYKNLHLQISPCNSSKNRINCLRVNLAIRVKPMHADSCKTWVTYQRHKPMEKHLCLWIGRLNLLKVFILFNSKDQHNPFLNSNGILRRNIKDTSKIIYNHKMPKAEIVKRKK